MNPLMLEIDRSKRRKAQIHNAKALWILGCYHAAAFYLKRCGFSLEAALWILCRRESRVN